MKCDYRLLVCFGVLLLAYGLAAQSSSVFDTEGEARILAELNQSRAEAGVAPLKVDPELIEAARRHALLLSKRHVLSHQFPGEPALMERLSSGGVLFTAAAENVGMNTELSDVNSMFLRSPGHRANMLNGAYDAVGIGVIQVGPSYWITEDFAKLTPALSAQQAEDKAAASFESKWKAAHPTVPKRISMDALRESACQAAKSGGRLRRTTFSYEGRPAREIVGFSAPDPSELSAQVDTATQDVRVGAYAVGACTPEQSGDPGQFWIVMAFF